jgi:hypothetical protein
METTTRDRLEDPAPLRDCLDQLVDVLFCGPWEPEAGTDG